MNPNDNLDPIIAMTSRPQSLQSAPGWVSGKRKYTKEYRTIVTTIPLYPNPLHNPQTRSSATNKNSGSTCPLRGGRAPSLFCSQCSNTDHSLSTLAHTYYRRPPPAAVRRALASATELLPAGGGATSTPGAARCRHPARPSGGRAPFTGAPQMISPSKLGV